MKGRGSRLRPAAVLAAHIGTPTAPVAGDLVVDLSRDACTVTREGVEEIVLLNKLEQCLHLQKCAQGFVASYGHFIVILLCRGQGVASSLVAQGIAPLCPGNLSHLCTSSRSPRAWVSYRGCPGKGSARHPSRMTVRRASRRSGRGLLAYFQLVITQAARLGDHLWPGHRADYAPRWVHRGCQFQDQWEITNGGSWPPT